MEAFSILTGALIGFVLIISLIGLVGYVVGSLTYMKLADKAGIENSWYAWVPILNSVLYLKIANFSLWFLALPFIASIILQSQENEPGLSSFFTLLLLILYCIMIDGAILERFGKSKTIAYWHLLPIFGSLFVMINIMILAFGDAKAEY